MVSKILRADGVTELASIQSVTYHESVNADIDLRPGCVASSYIEVTCFGAQSDAPDVGEALTYYQVVGETETLIGIFYAEPSIPTKNSYKFIAYDAVHKLDADFSAWLSAHQEGFPYTVYQLVSQACTIAGVTLGSSSWANSTMEVNAWYADSITCRNILQYAAEIACKFVRCNTSGEIVFDWYKGAASGETETASGAIATFDDGADRVPLKSLTAQITPVQDLHGYSNPWPAGGGKNILPFPYRQSSTGNWTVHSDGTVTYNGTATTADYLWLYGSGTSPIPDWVKPNTVYSVSCGNGTFRSASPRMQMIFYGNPSVVIMERAMATPSDFSQYTGFSVVLFVPNGTTVNYTCHPQIEESSTPTAWTPYSNECPISGRTGTEVWDDPKHGRNVKWNQLLKNPHFTEGTSGLQYWYTTNATVTNLEDGSVSLTITAVHETQSYYNLLRQTLATITTLQHKFLVLWDYKPAHTHSAYIYLIRSSGVSGNHGQAIYNIVAGEWNRLAYFVPAQDRTFYILQLALNATTTSGYSVGDVDYIRYPQMFDLTEMFGAGNEPTTLDEFKALFPNDCYDYNSGEVTCVSAVNGDPYRHVQVEWEDEAGTVYGAEVDVVNGKLTAKKVSITLDGSSDEGWSIYDPDNYNSYCFVLSSSDKKIEASSSICNEYENVQGAWGYGGNNKFGVFSDHTSLARWYFTRPNPNFEKSLASWKTWLASNPLQICYELAVPVEYQLTPQEVTSLLGTNNIWATTGDIEVEYYPTLGRIYPSSGTDESGDKFAYKQDGLTYDNYETSAVARVAVHPVGEDEVAYYYPTNVTSGNTLNITNNALLYGASAENMTAIAQSIYTAMTAFGTYRPMTVEMFPNECPFKSGDIVPVTDAQGVSFTTAIMEKTVTDSAVTLTSTGREVYGDYALDTAKQLVQLAADIVRINKLKVGWAEIDEAVVGVLTSIGMNPDEVVVSANTVTEYYLSTSSSSATGGSWSTSIPTWSSGKYVWARDKTTNGYADGTSSTSYSPSQNGVYDANLTTALSTAASASSAASTAQSTANGANAREQTIYISKASGTSSVSANTTWVTNATGNQNTWTTKRPVYNGSYPVLFIAQQSQTVSQYNGGSGTACSCTTPVKDDTTTVIDGGHITTGSIDANRITTGALTIRDANNNIIFKADASNKKVEIGGWTIEENGFTYTDSNNQVTSFTTSSGLVLNSDTRAQITRGGVAWLSSIGISPMSSLPTSTDQFNFYVIKSGANANMYLKGTAPLQRFKNTNADATASSVTANTSPIEFLDKNDVRVGFLQSGQDASGNVYMWIGSQRKNGSADLVNDLTLWTYANGTRGVSVGDPSAWRTAIGAVNKAGDTMTGNLSINNSNPGAVEKNTGKSSADAVTATDNSIGFRVTDQNSNIVALYTDRYLADGNLVGAWIAGARMVNGSNVFNSLQLLVDSSGNQVVTLSTAAWRKALDMCYAVNDTMSITSSAVLHGFVSSKRQLYLDFIVDKSMENISSVTVTTMTGTLQGVSGAIGGSNNINFISSGYTVSCIKQSLHHIRISVAKTSDFSNATAATPMTYFGTLTLKFT